MNNKFLPVAAFCIARCIFWFGGVDLLVRNGDNGVAMFVSLMAAILVFCIAKEVELSKPH